MSVLTDLCRVPQGLKSRDRAAYITVTTGYHCSVVGWFFYHKHQGVCLVVMKRTWGGAGRRRPGLVFRPQKDGQTYAAAGCMVWERAGSLGGVVECERGR